MQNNQDMEHILFCMEGKVLKRALLPTDEEASFLPYLRDLLIYKNSVDTSKQMLQLVYASLDFMIAGSGMLNQFKTQSELAEYIKKGIRPY